MIIDIDSLARKHGIAPEYEGTDGVKRLVPHETKLRLLEAIGIAPTESDVTDLEAELRQPQPSLNQQCYLPSWLTESRVWGISLQLYELRSKSNWGIGDFADLRKMVEIAAGKGADFIGLNPLHALFLSEPDRNSPFSPSNRSYLNPIYIAVPLVSGYVPEAEEVRIAASLRDGDLVDYREVVALKLRALRRCWHLWQNASSYSSRSERDSFKLFKGDGGLDLRSHALFEALSFYMIRSGFGSGWSTWPSEYHSLESASVEEFSLHHAPELEFHSWLQWLATVQLNSVKEAAHASGMRIGLYLDFAVGEAPDGSATWIRQQDYIRGFKIGAPPDVFSAQGQDWGLAALSPATLETKVSNSDLFNQAMQNGGALRIDHAMSLRQLFLVPDGELPSNGTYIRYPTLHLLEHLSEASKNNSCIVIGEDLGNVPEGFRDEMQSVRILSYRVLYFEKEQARFNPATDYPALAFACLSTHDLPTLAAWWKCDDIGLRLHHTLVDDDLAEQQVTERLSERKALLKALMDFGLVNPNEHGEMTLRLGELDFSLPGAIAIAVHRFIAKTPCLLAGIRLADLTGETKPTNLPGTDPSTYPNWRQKSSILLEDMSVDDRFMAIVEAVAAERPRS
jgi:4-alpha-glucanotransferase